jgi:hypothetical protein
MYALANLAAISVPSKMISSEKQNFWNTCLDDFDNAIGFKSSIELHPNEKERIKKDAIDWLRVHDPNHDNINDSTLEALLSVASVPLPADWLNSAEKEKLMKEFILFLRNNNPAAENVDDPTIQALADIAGTSFPQGSLKPKWKKGTATEALDWLRHNIWCRRPYAVGPCEYGWFTVTKKER